jgi:hypothetical protein
MKLGEANPHIEVGETTAMVHVESSRDTDVL